MTKKTNTQHTSPMAANENAPEAYVALEEVAKFLGVTPSAIRKWRERGELPFPAYSIGRCIRFRLSEVDAFARSTAHRNAAEARAARLA